MADHNEACACGTPFPRFLSDPVLGEDYVGCRPGFCLVEVELGYEAAVLEGREEPVDSVEQDRRDRGDEIALDARREDARGEEAA